MRSRERRPWAGRSDLPCRPARISVPLGERDRAGIGETTLGFVGRCLATRQMRGEAERRRRAFRLRERWGRLPAGVATGSRPNVTSGRAYLRFAAGFLAMACLLTSATAGAESRVALVVGNGDYSRSPDLRNPANDARAMAKMLRSLDFRLVGNRAHVDVSRDAMLTLLDELEDLLEPGATALVFYSGHGVAENGTNWLVPVNDDAIRFREDVRDRAVGVDSVLHRLQGRGGGVNIVILDACRSNPLPRRHESRNALAKGLGPMNAPSESVIVYAAAPGRVAYDGTGSLSPFTGALIEAMGQPGRELMQVLGATAAAVRASHHGDAGGHPAAVGGVAAAPARVLFQAGRRYATSQMHGQRV